MLNIEQFKRLTRDLDFMLKSSFAGNMDTGNPYFAWEAINVCVKHKKQFPDWVVGYLGLCAESMLSDEAKDAHDLREVLPSVLCFDTKLGRGNLLDPHGNLRPDAIDFALSFATYIEKGEKPSKALKSACDVLEDADRDEKTLRRWLLEEFEQDKWLKTNAEWKIVARNHFKQFVASLEALYREIAP